MDKEKIDSILHHKLPFVLWKIYLNLQFKYWNFQFNKEKKRGGLKIMLGNLVNKKVFIVIYLLWSLFSVGFGLSSIIHCIWSLQDILIYGSSVWIEPNIFIAVSEIISLSVSFVWVFVIGTFWCSLLIREFKKEREEKQRLWCTKCDVNMVDKGIALDCPEDGIFYICPTCNHRIVIFKKEVSES